MKLNIEAPYTNLSDYAITDNATVIQDGFMDATKAIRKRPGLLTFLDLTLVAAKYVDIKPDGVYWFHDISALIICCAGDVIKVTDKFGTYSVIGTDVLAVGVPVIFAKCSDSANSNTPTLFMANGGVVVSTTGTSCTNVSGANIPTKVTHIATVNGYLITNDLDEPTLWKHSDALTPFTWGSAFSYSAQGKTDNIQGLFESRNRLFVCGACSIEPFYDSGFSIPFQRIEGGLVEVGGISPYSFAKLGSDIYFLSSEREIMCLSSGSYTPTIISDSYATRLRELSTVVDVQASCLTAIGGRRYVLFSFNEAKTTIVFDPQMNAFYEWGYWRPDDNDYEQFLGVCYSYSPDWNYNLICDRTTGIVYRIEESYLSDNTESIRHVLETGTYDFGDPTVIKTLNNLFIHIVRGKGLSPDPDNLSTKAYLEIKTDFASAWSNPAIEIDMGLLGDSQIGDTTLQGGVFRTIKFRITQMGKSDYAMCGIYLNYGLAN